MAKRRTSLIPAAYCFAPPSFSQMVLFTSFGSNQKCSVDSSLNTDQTQSSEVYPEQMKLSGRNTPLNWFPTHSVQLRNCATWNDYTAQTSRMELMLRYIINCQQNMLNLCGFRKKMHFSGFLLIVAVISNKNF